MAIKHSVVVTGPNDPSKEVSKDAWNAEHTIDSAADVPFVQSGIGAIAEDLQTLLRRLPIDVFSFIPTALHAGIIANTDTTDLYTYITAAITEAESKKRPLRIGAGKFHYNTGLEIDGVDLICDGPFNTVLKFRGTGSALTLLVSGGGVNQSLETRGFTLEGDTGVVGQDGLHVKGSMNGWDGGRIICRNFDGFGCKFGVNGSFANFFSTGGYIWCHAKDRTGTTGFHIDGNTIPNNNANTFQNIYVNGKWVTYFDIGGNGNVLIAPVCDFNNADTQITEVFKISGTGTRVYGAYFEIIGAITTFPTAFIRFTTTAKGNLIDRPHLNFGLPAGGLEKYILHEGDSYSNEVIGTKPTGVNFSLTGSDVSGHNLLQNTGFHGLNGSPSVSNTPWGWFTFGATAMTRDTTTVRGKAASLKLTGTNQACYQYLYSSTANRARYTDFNEAAFLGRHMTSGCWVYSTTAGCGTIRLGSGGTNGTATSASHSGSSEWEWLTCQIKVDPDAADVSEVYLHCRINSGVTGDAYFSEPIVVFGTEVPQSTPAPMYGDHAYVTGRLVKAPFLTFTDQDATPDVSTCNNWTTANTAATTVTTLDGGYRGQEVTVVFGDALTTIDFTSTTMKGNGGRDWSPMTNDLMTCTHNGTNWICAVTDNTSTCPSANTTAVGNVTTGEDNLMTFALPATTLRRNGNGVRITAWGTAANNANAKTLKLYFGTVAMYTATLTVSEALTWEFSALVFRTGVDAQDFKATFQQEGTTEQHDVDVGTLTQDDGAAITIKCAGEGVSTNDIVQEGMLVEYLS